MIRPLEYVKEIKPYIPGKPLSELERELGITGSVKLASNENPLGPSKKAIRAIKNFIANPSEVGRYPDGGGFYLRNAIATRLSVRNMFFNLDNIILGNGSNELIDIAVRTYMTHGDEAVMATPSFVVYSMAVKAVGAKAVEIPLIDYRHDLKKMAEAINDKTKIVFIANPNNPTGTINKKDEFKAFMKKLPQDVLLIVDEAYFEYVQDRQYPDSLKYLSEGRNILVLRTFSKAYGLAGLRIGYGVSKPEIIAELNKIREPFNTNSISQVAALSALLDKAHLRKSIALNQEGKQYLYKALDGMGVRYVPSEANFIYIPLERDAMQIYNFMLKEGVIIRPVGPKEIRVTIGLPEENQRFIEAFKKVLNS